MNIFRQFLNSPVWGAARTILIVLLSASLVSSCSSGGSSGRQGTSKAKDGKGALTSGGTSGGGVKASSKQKDLAESSVQSKVYDNGTGTPRDSSKPALPTYIEKEKDPVKRDYLIWRYSLIRVANKLDVADYDWQKTFRALSEGKLSKEHASQQLDVIQKELAAAKVILGDMVTPKTLKKEHQRLLDDAKANIGQAVSSWEIAVQSAKDFMKDQKRNDLVEKAVAEMKKARTAVIKAAEDSLKVKRDLGLSQDSKS